MNALNLVIFDDARGQWGPMTDLRALFDLRTGMLTPHERLVSFLKPATLALLVPDALAVLTTQAHPGTAVNTLTTGHEQAAPPASQADHLLVYAGLSLPDTLLQVKNLKPGQALMDDQQRLVAARVTRKQALAWQQSRWCELPPSINAADCSVVTTLLHPWDIQAHLDATLRFDLLACNLPEYARDKPDVTTAGVNPIKMAKTAKIHPMVVINAEKGPVVIDEHAVIGSFAVVAGPCYIGKHTIIAPHTHVRATCSIGPSCVVGGEVSAIVMQSYSNKAHAGYLGNSLVGQWVNLGADTNVSNLKNTYGHVRMQLEVNGPSHNSRLTKLGPVIGDYVRTAIGSRLLTGSTIGTGSMLAVSDFSPKFIDRFTFLTDQSCLPYDMDKFVETARYMMSRRDMPFTEAHETRLRMLAIKTTVV